MSVWFFCNVTRKVKIHFFPIVSRLLSKKRSQLCSFLSIASVPTKSINCVCYKTGISATIRPTFNDYHAFVMFITICSMRKVLLELILQMVSVFSDFHLITVTSTCRVVNLITSWLIYFTGFKVHYWTKSVWKQKASEVVSKMSANDLHCADVANFPFNGSKEIHVKLLI